MPDHMACENICNAATYSILKLLCHPWSQKASVSPLESKWMFGTILSGNVTVHGFCFALKRFQQQLSRVPLPSPV